MKTVLIIEDDPVFALELEEELQAQYTIEKSVEGMNAVSKVYATNPELILLDIDILGEMDGLGVLKTIRADETYKKIPVIVLTNAGEEARSPAMTNGATEFLLKSEVSLEAIHALVNQHLG
jgi:two-component system alkaline phosphatase synthesis response regulator PhoP